LSDWEIFDKDILNLSVDVCSVCIHAGASDTWREFGVRPGVVCLALDSPSTLRSVSLWTDRSTVCTITSDVTTIKGYVGLVTTFVPLFIGSFIGLTTSLHY
jgi:hypothetical protein